MKFAGKVWRLLVGIKDGLVLILMLLFFGALYAALSASPYQDSARDGALRLDLAGAIVEQPSEADFASVVGGAVTREYRLSEIVHALNRAAEDDRIKAVALDLDILAGGGQSALASVGEELDRVRRAGKKVVAFSTAYSDDTYQLASHADEIWLDPLGAVLVAGPGGSNLYYAGLMEKLGVTANVYRVGAFKSAVEPYTRSDMSPEAKAAAQALASSLWETWQQDVAKARPRAQLAAYVQDPMRFIRAANGDMARAALQAGMVDKVADRSAFARRMTELAGAGPKDQPDSYRAVHLDAWIDRHPVSHAGGEIGILTVAGTIMDGEASPGTAGAETIVANLEKGLSGGRLKALVVRVDSPGGSVTASERIRRSIDNVRRRGIPVVISFGSVAASGGYWIATAGDTIFAQPSTITGSIGVFGVLPSFEGSLQKLGIGVDGVGTTPLSGEPDLMRGPSPAADQLLQMGVETSYRRFLSLVARARKLPVQRVHEIAQGRVWDGGTARQIGLVDRFGDMDEALQEAAKRANLDIATVRPVWLEAEPGFMASFARGFAAKAPVVRAHDPFARLAADPEQAIRRAFADVQSLLKGSALQARCLECPLAAPAPGPREIGLFALLKAQLLGR